MGSGWTAFLILAGLVLLMCLLPVEVQIRYLRDGEKDHLRLRVQTLSGLVAYTMEIPVIDLMFSKNKNARVRAKAESGAGEQAENRRSPVAVTAEQIRRTLRAERKITEKLLRFHHHVGKATKTFRITKMNWHTELGAGDAALTGTASGWVWLVKGAAVGWLSRFFSLSVKPDLSVQPRFEGLVLRTRFDCIIRFWVGQAIMAGIQLGIYMLREGKKSWRIIRSKV